MIELGGGVIEVVQAVDDQHRDQRADAADQRPRRRIDQREGGAPPRSRPAGNRRSRGRPAGRRSRPATRAAAAACRSRAAIPARRSAPRSDRAADWGRAAPAARSRPRHAAPGRRQRPGPAGRDPADQGKAADVDTAGAPGSNRAQAFPANKRANCRYHSRSSRLRGPVRSWNIGARRRESVRRARRGPPRNSAMVRLSAIFIGVCMVLIAASLGAVLYLGFKLDVRSLGHRRARRAGRHGALQHDHQPPARPPHLGDQIADLSRGTADLARQVAEIGRRLNAMETASTRRSAARAARSSRSPPRSANSARWCARSPRRSPPTPPSCRSRASSAAPPAPMPRAAAPAPDGALHAQRERRGERRAAASSGLHAARASPS